MHDEHAVVGNTRLILFQVFIFEGGGSDGRNSFSFFFSQTAEIERSLRGRGVCKTRKCFYLCLSRCVELFIKNQSMYADLISHVALLIL